MTTIPCTGCDMLHVLIMVNSGCTIITAYFSGLVPDVLCCAAVGLLHIALPSLLMLNIDWTCASEVVTLETLRQAGQYHPPLYWVSITLHCTGSVSPSTVLGQYHPPLYWVSITLHCTGSVSPSTVLGQYHPPLYWVSITLHCAVLYY